MLVSFQADGITETEQAGCGQTGTFLRTKTSRLGPGLRCVISDGAHCHHVRHAQQQREVANAVRWQAGGKAVLSVRAPAGTATSRAVTCRIEATAEPLTRTQRQRLVSARRRGRGSGSSGSGPPLLSTLALYPTTQLTMDQRTKGTRTELLSGYPCHRSHAFV